MLRLSEPRKKQLIISAISKLDVDPMLARMLFVRSDVMVRRKESVSEGIGLVEKEVKLVLDKIKEIASE